MKLFKIVEVLPASVTTHPAKCPEKIIIQYDIIIGNITLKVYYSLQALFSTCKILQKYSYMFGLDYANRYTPLQS